jgi:hypothetical protein
MTNVEESKLNINFREAQNAGVLGDGGSDDSKTSITAVSTLLICKIGIKYIGSSHSMCTYVQDNTNELHIMYITYS